MTFTFDHDGYHPGSIRCGSNFGSSTANCSLEGGEGYLTGTQPFIDGPDTTVSVQRQVVGAGTTSVRLKVIWTNERECRNWDSAQGRCYSFFEWIKTTSYSPWSEVVLVEVATDTPE